jgi:hypothetical protein
MTNAFEIGCERHERERPTDMVEEIADCLLEDHMALMTENAAMRKQIADLAHPRGRNVRADTGHEGARMKPQEKDYASHVSYARALEAYCEGVERQLAEVQKSEALAKQVAFQSQEAAKDQYRQRITLEKFIEGKNGYKERIQQLYEENLRLGNEQIDLADKTREECAKLCERLGAYNEDDPQDCEPSPRAYAKAIRAMKERP